MSCTPWRGFGSSLGLALSIILGTMVTNILANELIQKFKDIFEKVHNNRPPDWAWPFKPSIPFIGGNYKPGQGLLIYASAENLSWHNNKDNPLQQFFTEERVWDRYRAQYEILGRDSGDFFPNLGIQPLNDGGLLAAGLFTAIKYGFQYEPEPRPFLETIAVTNWCKFSIKSATNRDYICDAEKLVMSLAFAEKELALLQPKIVLLPKAVYSTFQVLMKKTSPQSIFLPVYQFNIRVVNCVLRNYEEKAIQLKKCWREHPLADWMDNLCPQIRKNGWRYIAKLDEEIQLRNSVVHYDTTDVKK